MSDYSIKQKPEEPSGKFAGARLQSWNLFRSRIVAPLPCTLYILLNKNLSQNRNSNKSRGNLQGEWDDFRTFRWIEEIESVDLLIKESRELLET